MTARLSARLAGVLASLMLALAPAPRALAQSAPEADPDQSQQLYQQALQSISEGRKNDASETLMRLIEQEPQHAGAWLEVALIQCELGHAEEAERLFTTIEERFKPSRGILDLIAGARATGCAQWHRYAQSSFSFGRGIDQNVNQGATVNTYTTANLTGTPVELPLTDDFLPKHDQYTLLTADYLSDLTPNGTIGFAQFQGRRYDRLGRYNSSSLFLGFDTPWRYGNWTLHGSATVGLITLGTGLYQRQTQVQARVGPPLPLPGSMQFSVTTGLTHVDYMTLSNFNANTWELRGQFNYRLEEDSASASLAYLDDRATGARPGGDRRGWLFTSQWRRRLSDSLNGELAYTRQTWNSSSAYSPGFINEVRAQTTQVLRATLTYPLSQTQSIQLEARQVRNRENISIFQYNDRQLQLSWQWQGL
ncbi:tetratricopeptide repeat protein [Duganella alba]|nr:tetratricopeptide repeat protein [Duganella alba]